MATRSPDPRVGLPPSTATSTRAWRVSALGTVPTGLVAVTVPSLVAGRPDRTVRAADGRSTRTPLATSSGVRESEGRHTPGRVRRGNLDRLVLLVVGLLALSSLVGAAYLLVSDGGLESVVPWVSDGATTGGPHEVAACTTITDPGRYLVTTDLESEADVCLEVVASDVVLDGGGHLIFGTLDQGSTAVAVGPSREAPGPLRNVTVRNLTVENWVFGVVYTDVDGGTVEGVRTFHNVEAITVVDSADVTVRNVSVREGCVGLDLVRARDVSIVDTEVRWVSIVGVSVVDSRNVAFSDVTVAHANVGISLFRSTDVSYENVTETGLDGDSLAVERVDATGCTYGCEVPIDCDMAPLASSVAGQRGA